MRNCQSLPLCQTNECSVCLNGQPFISKKKTNVYQGQRCFIFSPERTRPCRMLNNFHLCSCLPRLIVVLSPSTVETTHQVILPRAHVHIPVVILSGNGSMQIHILHPARGSTNKQTLRGKKQS